MNTYTTTSRHCDLYRVPARLADFLEVQRLMGSFVLPSVDGQRSSVD